MYGPNRSSVESLSTSLLARSGGQCECSGSCDHHPPRRCKALIKGFWRVGLIVPTELGGKRSIGNTEVLCEACKVGIRLHLPRVGKMERLEARAA